MSATMNIDQGIQLGHGGDEAVIASCSSAAAAAAGSTLLPPSGGPFPDHLPRHHRSHSHSLEKNHHHQHNLHHLQQQNYRLPLDVAPESPALPEPHSYLPLPDKPFSPAPPVDTRPSQIPIPHTLAAANASPSFSAAGHVYAPPSPVDPDDFYRSYRGVQTAGNASLSPNLANDSMASAIPSNRQPQATRSNGTTAASKIPSVPAHRNALRPSYRSASNPVDDRSSTSTTTKSQPATGYSPASAIAAFPPSVKDLKKRFDQSASQSASAPRKTSTSTPRPARDTVSTTINGRSQPSGGSATSYSTLRASATRDTGHEPAKASGTRGTQRSKFVPEDQLSSNSQSFASRISRPRNAVSPNRQASKSMTRVSSHTSPTSSTSQLDPPRANGLLFGEILPEDSDLVTAGFGIEPPRPRRTSESNVQDVDRARLRSFSDPEVDAEPPSPTDWYRGVPSSRQDPDSNATGTAANHARAQSDLVGSESALNYTPTSPTSPTSRLPILMKRMSNSSTPTSPISTRSNSPGAAKFAPASGRTSRQHGALATRSKTPTARSNTPSNLSKNLSSSASGSARKPPPSNIATPGSGRLSAYVSAVPAPKLSPSLRSSRPRQSVATATTTASRMRAVDGAGQSSKSRQRANSKTEDASASSTRRRKVSVGPIDFAQRRETIKLAYSKSIRESQAREARQQAAERRKKELEVVAQRKAEAEAATIAAVASAATAQAIENAPPAEREREKDRALPEQPLKITTNLTLTTTHLDSPTLGIPGSFPDVTSPPLDQEEIPQSAVSTTTFTTEFDQDEQTEPPRKESVSESVSESLQAIDNGLGIMGFSQAPNMTPAVYHDAPSPTLTKRSSYHSPFDEDDMDDGDVSIKISLDESIQPSPSPQLTPTRTEFQGLGPVLAPPTEDEYEPQPYAYSSPVYQTTVTILGPENDFKPLYREQTNDNAPSPNLSQPDSAPPSATLGAVSHSSLSAGLLFEEPTQDIDSMERLEDFYVGPRLRDNIASLRDSTFTSSEPDISYDAQPSSSEYQKTPDTSNSLSVPTYLTPGNRLSHTSAWTDFSFGSDDRNAGPASSTTHSHDLNKSEEKLGHLPTPEVGGLGIRRSSSPILGDSADSLSLGIITASDPSMLADSLIGSSKVSLQQDYGSSAMRRDFSSVELSRDDYDLDDSTYVGVTRPSSYLHDQDDESEELTLAASNSDSIGQSSIEILGPASTINSLDKPLSPEARDSLDKEQKRLRQRQLVIRELIDTEDTFVRDMSVVEEIYKGTAEACPNLDNKTIKLVFRNTDEIIAFHQAFLIQLKEGASSVYTPKGRRSPTLGQQEAKDSDAATMNSGHSGGTMNKPELDDERDRQTCLGPLFSKNIGQLKTAHEAYLRSSDLSSKRLLQIQEDATVKVWLSECNQVAKELTSAWNLDSLLIKPMQRITKYPDIITHLLKYTPDDHPDREALVLAKTNIINAIDEINKSKKNFELVGQIVGSRKRKESDVRLGIARAFGKRVDRLNVSTIKTADDDEFKKLHKNCHEEFLQLQFVLRDVEFYTETVTNYVQDFLKYLSSMELVMRLQPSREYAHLESKWVQFNVSMRDIENIALEKHLSDVRKHVIEPFEQVIKCYNNPLLAIKKRSKRRIDYDKYLQLKSNGKKVDKQLTELAEQYEALNDTLKKELPKLSALTAKVGNICLGKFVGIQTAWYAIWKEKVKGPLHDLGGHIPEPPEIVSTFQREFMLQEERAMAIGILNPTLKGRTSQSTTDDSSSTFSKTRSRPSDLLNPRGRGLSINSDHNLPTLPTPDFGKRNSGQFSLSPNTTLPSPGHYYRDYYPGVNGHARGGSNSPITTDTSAAAMSASASVAASRSTAGGLTGRPNTGRSYESMSLPRQSTDSTALTYAQSQSRRDSNSTFNSIQPGPGLVGQQQHDGRRLSGIFHSALPLPDGPEESRLSSRASSRDRGGYQVLWLAASLFEFNIETTKHEAGYPYLTYQAGEIFDVIAEKGELWLAKNQDDPSNGVGWIWSKHFAKLADA